MNRVIGSFIKSMNDLLETFLMDKNVEFFTPHVFIIFIISLTFLSSFSSRIVVLFSILIVSTFISFSSNVNRGKLLKIVVVIIAFNIIVALPKILLYGFNNHIFMFLLRTVISGLIFTTGMLYLGFNNFLKGLRTLGIPKRTTVYLHLFLYNSIVLSREMLKILLARFSRNIRNGYGSSWNALGSTVASLLVKSNYKSKMQYLALKSRGGLEIVKCNDKIRRGDILLILVIAWLIFLSF